MLSFCWIDADVQTRGLAAVIQVFFCSHSPCICRVTADHFVLMYIVWDETVKVMLYLTVVSALKFSAILSPDYKKKKKKQGSLRCLTSNMLLQWHVVNVADSFTLYQG